MLVVITYDVNTMTVAGEKRLRREQNYRSGMVVQNSVFEVLVDATQLYSFET